MKKLLVIGQTPPPHGGQAMMIDRLVKARFDKIKIYHLRMAFSGSFKSMEKAEFGKIVHLFEIIIKAIFMKYRFGINTMYYPPAGPFINPVLRDTAILIIIRIFFKRTIFHFRSAGLSEYVPKQFWGFRVLLKKVYNKPDAAIQQSSLNPEDGNYFKAKKTYIIQNGLEDAALDYLPITKADDPTINILSVGLLSKSKGTMVLLKAIKILVDKGSDISVQCLGEFYSEKFEKEVLSFCADNSLENVISFPGSKSGKEKWDYYQRAAIFCFPTFFEAESFGNVAVEAMMFELPVVASRWRGVPDIVEDGQTGYLVPSEDEDKLAEALGELINNYDLRVKLGKRGREKFLHQFTLERHLAKMEEVLDEVAI